MYGHLESTSQRRVRWLARIAFVWAGLLVLRLVQLQVFSHQELSARANRQQRRSVPVTPARGSIVDRHGEPLAFSRLADTLAVNPRMIPNVENFARLIASPLEMDPRKIQALIEAHRTRGYLVIQQGLKVEQSQRLALLPFGDYMHVFPEVLRQYPEGNHAAHVVGALNHENEGFTGLEAWLNSDLQGTAGRKTLFLDGKARAVGSIQTEAPMEGASIVTTIDRVIQYEAERILAEKMKTCRCEGGSIVVMNPHTGEILALAVAPNFDRDKKLRDKADWNARRVRAVQDQFEPGSVMKTVTVAAGVDMGRISAESLIPCPPTVKIKGRKTPLSNGGHGSGMQTVRKILDASINTGTYYIAVNRVGAENLHRYMAAFGFGEKTGVELPGEAAGGIGKASTWKPVTMGQVSRGYGMSASTIQLAQAYAIVANGGRRVKPTLLLQRVSNGKVIQIATQPGASSQVIKPETAIAMRNMLESVVLTGTGKKAKLDGWSSAGKTGTSFITEKGQYTKKKNASFVGFAPVNNPALVVAVSMHGGPADGADASAPVFRDVMMRALNLLSVQQDVPSRVLTEDEKTETIADAIEEEADVAAEEDEAETGQPLEVGLMVPNYKGKSANRVIQMSRETNMPVDIIGSGVARRQTPKAGSRLKPGERIRVEFAH